MATSIEAPWPAMSAARSAAQGELPQLRRRRKALRRSRAHPLERLLGPVLVALAVLLALATALTWLLATPKLAVSDLRVTTGGWVEAEWVHRTLRPFAGRSLLLLDLEEVEAELLGHAWVAAVDLRKRLPAGLEVRVVERRAAAVLRDGDALVYLDEQGEPIAPFAPQTGVADLVLVTLRDPRAEPAAAVRLMREIEHVAPPWGAGLSEIEVLGEEDFRIYTDALTFPLLVRAGTLNHKARHLETLLPHIRSRFGPVAAVDLRFARRIIVQPIVPERATARHGAARS